MTEPTGCAVRCARADTYCSRCDLLVGLPGLHVVDVVDVVDVGERLTVTVESAAIEQGCRGVG